MPWFADGAAPEVVLGGASWLNEKVVSTPIGSNHSMVSSGDNEPRTYMLTPLPLAVTCTSS